MQGPCYLVSWQGCPAICHLTPQTASLYLPRPNSSSGTSETAPMYVAKPCKRSTCCHEHLGHRGVVRRAARRSESRDKVTPGAHRGARRCRHCRGQGKVGLFKTRRFIEQQNSQPIQNLPSIRVTRTHSRRKFGLTREMYALRVSDASGSSM